MSILEYNGSGCVAMIGKDCVCIASDTRFGNRNLTVTRKMQKIFRIHDRLYVGLTGLATDIQTVYSLLRFRVKLFMLKENREIAPAAFASLVSSLLYSRRFGPWFVEPVVCGLDSEGKPFISAMDLIGAPCFTGNFVVSGTSSEALYGMCESLWKPDLSEDEVFEVASQSLLAAVDRDTFAGWGAVAHIITADKVVTKRLKVRQD